MDVSFLKDISFYPNYDIQGRTKANLKIGIGHLLLVIFKGNATLEPQSVFFGILLKKGYKCFSSQTYKFFHSIDMSFFKVKSFFPNYDIQGGTITNLKIRIGNLLLVLFKNPKYIMLFMSLRSHILPQWNLTLTQPFHLCNDTTTCLLYKKMTST